MPWDFVALVHDPEVRKLCPRRYPGHPKGCPNYGKKAGCPPQAPLLLDINEPSWRTAVIWNRFEFGEHVERMRSKHPDWSERQLECCLYWQGTARKALKEQIKHFKRSYPFYEITRCPEAMGVDVTATMKRAGIKLEWPPERYAYQVAVGFVRTREV